jgi:hypothetical protein
MTTSPDSRSAERDVQETVAMKEREQLNTPWRVRHSLIASREHPVTSADFGDWDKRQRRRQCCTNLRRYLRCFGLRFVIAVTAISLATSTASILVALIQLQLFTSNEAFNVALQEPSYARNANSSRSIFMRETEAVRLLLPVQRIRRAGKIPLLEMLFAVQRKIAVRKKGLILNLMIGNALSVVTDAGKLHQMASDVETGVKSAQHITLLGKLYLSSTGFKDFGNIVWPEKKNF